MLRPYQQEMYNKAREALKTCNGVCVVLPCRAGKSYIMKAMADSACVKGKKVLILAHRRLLLRQHAELIKNCRIESVFTEINHLGENGPVDLIVIDEAHLSGAQSYHTVCDYYKCKRVLFTATAKRLDNKPLDLADAIINGISGDELIELGAISPYSLYAPKVDIDLSKAKMSGYDFNVEDITDIMMDKKIYGDIIKYYHELAEGMQTIAYCTSIKHSQSICELFNSNGISAMHMDATTPEKQRDKIIKEFKAGKFKVLCNCNLISEGLTVPECDCCLLLRPTQSETLYIQQACRCLTPRDGKKAVIIDFVGNCYAHGTPTEKREYTLEKQPIKNPSRKPEVACRECKHCFRVYAGKDRICPYCGADNGKTRAEIEADEKAELERIKAAELLRKAEEKERRRQDKIKKEFEIKRKKIQQAMATTYQDLVKIGKERKMNNPEGWARKILWFRSKKKKGKK